MAAPVPRVELGQIVRRVCYSAHKDLENLSLKMANVDSDTRKRLLVVFFNNIRHRMIKLLTVVKWCVRSGQMVDDLLALVQDYASNELRIFLAVDVMRRSASTLRVARAPAYDITTALDVLSTGTYLKLPRLIAQLSGNPRLDDRLPEMDEEETLRKLEQYILDRLLRTSVPSQFSNIQVSNGTLICSVEHEFEVTLTLSGASIESPWFVLKVEVFVEGQSTNLEQVEAKKKKRRGISAFFDFDVSRELANVDNDSSSDDEEETNCEGSEKPKTSLKRKRKQVKVRDASSAFRPKKSAIFYLLKILQQTLLKSKDPLNDIYAIMHKFCASLSIKTLEAQARELTENHWKAGVLFVNSPKKDVLELRHWADSCVLRIQFDPKQRDGQLFVELDPPIDTASCRSSIALALSKTPPVHRRRELRLQNGDCDDSKEPSNSASSSALFVDGLCPSMLNVEKVLLLGALAHAEGRLHQLGIALDQQLLERELGIQPARALSKLDASLSWLPRFKHSISIVTEEDQVALHIDLPVQRYLRITVEMRTGEFILTLVRKSTAHIQSSADCHQTSRRWGSSSDLMLLSFSEKSVNESLKQDKIPGAANVLLKLLSMLSLHSIIESFELAAETEQMAYQRACPFIPSASARVFHGLKNQAIPCLFIRLNTWDGIEYFLGTCGKGSASKLYEGHPVFGAAGSGAAQQEENPLTDDGVPSNQLDWFVVAGPFERNITVDMSEIAISKQFTNVSENFSSDATVMAMFSQVLLEGNKQAMEIRAAKFMKHFTNSATIVPLPGGDQSIQIKFTSKMSGLVSNAFLNPVVVVAFHVEALGYDVSVERSAQTDRIVHLLPVGTDKPDLDLVFALTGCLKYNKNGLYLRYRTENGFLFTVGPESAASLGVSTATTTPTQPSSRSGTPAVEGIQKPQRQEFNLSSFSDISKLNLDLVAAAKMEIFCQCLLALRVAGSDDIISMGGSAGNSIKILYASHICAMLECRSGEVCLVVAIGIDTTAARKFVLRVLSVQKDTPGKLPLPEEIPWAGEIVKLLDYHIPSDLYQVDWEFLSQVVRQVLASLSFPLPCLPALNDILNPQPDCILNENKEKKVDTPQPAGGRARGKGLLSAKIQAQKESADNGARGVVVLPLSHLRLRVLVGEFRELDLLFMLDGTELMSKYQETRQILGGEKKVVDHNEFPRVLESSIKALLEAATK